MNGKNQGTSEFAARLNLLAVELVLDERPAVDLAIALACDLVAAGLDTPATVAVASLHRGTPLSEAGTRLNSMFAEQGVALPIFGSDHDRYATIQHAFANLDLPCADFEGPFYEQLVEWDEQGPLDRQVVSMLDERDNESRLSQRSEIEERMRAAIRQAQ